MTKPFKTIKEAEEYCKEIKSCATETDMFIAKCFPLILKLLATKEKTTKKKRKPSKWNLFFAEKIPWGEESFNI